MSQHPHGSPASTRVEELRRTQQKRQQRALIGFAVAEGFVLAIAVIVVYVLQLGERVGGSTHITFMTHTAQELDVQAALEQIRRLPCVREVESVIRAEA